MVAGEEARCRACSHCCFQNPVSFRERMRKAGRSALTIGGLKLQAQLTLNGPGAETMPSGRRCSLWNQNCSLCAHLVSNLRIIPPSVREPILGQKSVSESVGKVTRTALRTAARSIISCAIAPPIGGRYPNAATIIPKILKAIPPIAD